MGDTADSEMTCQQARSLWNSGYVGGFLRAGDAVGFRIQ